METQQFSAGDSKTSGKKPDVIRGYEASSTRKFQNSVTSAERAKSSVYKSKKKSKKAKKDKKRSKSSK